MIEFLIGIRRLVYIFIVFGIPLMYASVFLSSIKGCESNSKAFDGKSEKKKVVEVLYSKPTWEW